MKHTDRRGLGGRKKNESMGRGGGVDRGVRQIEARGQKRQEELPGGEMGGG